MKKYRTYTNPDGAVCIADQDGWIPGEYTDTVTALYAVICLSEAAIIRWLGPIYSRSGENRPVKESDVEKAWESEQESPTPKAGLTDAQKLAKIEEMMHPGYWSAMDSRRDKILEVLGSTRREWRGGNPFE